MTPPTPAANPSMDPPAGSQARSVREAVRATYLAFGAAGFAFASFAARIPQVRDGLDLSPSRLGLVLLALAAGSILSLPLAGPLVHRLGSRRTVAVMAPLLGVGLAIVALGYLVGPVPVMVGLFVVGLANGAWDVAMNVQGAIVEQRLGRSIMARFHAGFSLGTVAGALVGAAMVALGVSVTVHLGAVAVLIAVLVPPAVRRFIPDVDPDAVPHPDGQGGALLAWREPRTVLIGVFVLAFAFAEGVGNDWIGVAIIDGYDTPPAVGTLALAVFLAAMTTGRWFGPALLDRFGRVPVVRTQALVAIAGTALFVFAPLTALAFVGVLLWGLGTSLGFPVGMSAGADEPRLAAKRVSVIASIGYCAFLAGPPLIGFLGEQVSVLRALTSVIALLVLAAALAGVVRPPASSRRLP